MTFRAKIVGFVIPYDIKTIDLTVDNDDTEWDLKGRLANTVSVLKAESDFSIKLCEKTEESIPCEKGLWYPGTRFSKLYYSNAAATGEGKILVAWVDK